MHTKFILASSSKSRYKILKNSGLMFKKKIPKCDEEKIKKEIVNLKKKPTEYVKKLSYEKAKSISIQKKNTDNFYVEEISKPFRLYHFQFHEVLSIFCHCLKTTPHIPLLKPL